MASRSNNINNEILNFGKYDINLKKIIGSTNQYKPDEEEETDTDDGSDEAEQEIKEELQEIQFQVVLLSFPLQALL